MKGRLRQTVWFWLLGLAAIVVAVFVAPGCTTWQTRKYGDAKLKRVNYHFRAISIGVMPEYRDFITFPAVALDAPGTNIFRVRNFPTNRFIHAFALDMPRLASPPPQKGNTLLPWHKARIQIAARDTNGMELYTQQIALDELPRWLGDRYHTQSERLWWNGSWHMAELGRALSGRRDYDVVMIVEQPSAANARVRIRGMGGCAWLHPR